LTWDPDDFGLRPFNDLHVDFSFDFAVAYRLQIAPVWASMLLNQ